MARSRGRRRGRHGFKIPVVSVAIITLQALTAWENGGHTAVGAADQFVQYYTGVSLMQKKFYPINILLGWGPWLAKGFVGKIARGVGATPRIPFGLPISIS